MKRILVGIGAALVIGSAATAADTYTVDPAHSRVGFSVRHLGISNVKGKFSEFTGSLVVEAGALKDALATIQVTSVDTGVAQRDHHLRTADFFDVTNYPTIVFKTKKVKNSGKGFTLVGDFTMRGVTRELQVPIIISKPIRDPWGKMRVGLEARAKLNRKDYGIAYNQLLETGVAAVGEEVELEINAEAVKAEGDKSATKN